MNRLILLLIAVFCIINISTAQNKKEASSEIKPAWMGGDFPKNNKVSYFEISYSSGETYEIARAKALQKLKENRSLATGQIVEIVDKGDELSKVSSTDVLKVQARVEDIYWEKYKGEYSVYLLCQVAKNPDGDHLLDVKVTDSYGVGIRGLIPSAAQFYKGSNGKGRFFLFSEILLLGAGVTGTILSESAYDKAMDATTLHDRNKHKDNYNLYKDISTYAFIGAGVIYVWNVIDAYAAKPKLKRARLVAVPSFDYKTESFGVSLAFTF